MMCKTILLAILIVCASFSLACSTDASSATAVAWGDNQKPAGSTTAAAAYVKGKPVVGIDLPQGLTSGKAYLMVSTADAEHFGDQPQTITVKNKKYTVIMGVAQVPIALFGKPRVVSEVPEFYAGSKGYEKRYILFVPTKERNQADDDVKALKFALPDNLSTIFEQARASKKEQTGIAVNYYEE